MQPELLYLLLIAPGIFLLVLLVIVIQMLRKMKKQTKPEAEENISFVPATSDSISLINSLATEIWREHYTSLEGAEKVEYMLKLMYSPDIIAKDMAGGLEYFIIRIDGTDIGYLGVRNESTKLFLSRIYIKKAHRGRKIGHKAIDFICHLADTRQQQSIYLTVAKKNTSSIAFYEACGFTKAEAICNDIGGGYAMDDYIMRKELLM